VPHVCVCMGGKRKSVRSVEGAASACTCDSAPIARNVVAALFVSTVVSAANVKSVKAQVFVLTVGRRASAKSVGGVEFVSTGAAGIVARIAAARGSASTTGSRRSAETARVFRPGLPNPRKKG